MAKWRFFSFSMLLAVGTLAIIVSGTESLPNKEDSRIWVGEIKIVRIGSGYKQEDNSTSQLKDNSSTEKEVDEKITIKACGDFGELYIKEMNWTLTDKSYMERFTQEARTRCDFPPEAYKHNLLYRLKHYKQEVKEPGDSSSEKKQFFRELYPRKDNPIPKKFSKVILGKMIGQEYTLNVFYENWVSQTINEVLQIQHACSGKKEIHELHQRTSKIGQEATTNLTTTGEGESKHVIIDQTIPPIPFKMGFIAEVKINGDSISGSKVLGEIKPEHPGDYQEKTMASWNFTAKDPCQDVYNDLLSDLAFGEAYADKNIQDFADSIKQYEKMVDDRAYKTLHGEPPPREFEGDVAEGDLGVDPETCELKGKEEYEEKMAEQCKPDIIVDTTLAHEKTHESQCKKFHEEMNAGDPHIKGLMETTAYIKSAGMLLNWLEEHCPEIDIQDAKQRLEKLKIAKARRT